MSLHITVGEVATSAICDAFILFCCCTKRVFSTVQTAVIRFLPLVLFDSKHTLLRDMMRARISLVRITRLTRI
jgi:hypothetical protein